MKLQQVPFGARPKRDSPVAARHRTEDEVIARADLSVLHVPVHSSPGISVRERDRRLPGAILPSNASFSDSVSVAALGD
jgi:hypothetical protein